MYSSNIKNYKTDFCVTGILIQFRNNKFLKDVKVLQNIFFNYFKYNAIFKNLN